jgi:hypothetical protein
LCLIRDSTGIVIFYDFFTSRKANGHSILTINNKISYLGFCQPAVQCT